jgi:hypothetical protein
VEGWPYTWHGETKDAKGIVVGNLLRGHFKYWDEVIGQY